MQKFNNSYIGLIYSEDRDKYQSVLSKLSEGEQSISLVYRLNTKYKGPVYVTDISFSHHKKDGRMYGFSMISKLSDYHAPPLLGCNECFPSSAAPFGYIQCTCEKYPKVLYVNERLMEFLGESDDSSEWKNFLLENVFFLVPFEDRDLLKDKFEKAMSSSEPIKITHRIIKENGERVFVSGWLGTITNTSGEKNFSVVYTELGNNVVKNTDFEDNSYFKALKNAYNIIFEINTALNTVECIHGKDTSAIGKLYDVHMTLSSASDFWINNYILPEFRLSMKKFFDDISSDSDQLLSDHPLQTEFSIKWDDGIIYSFIGVAISLDASSVLFCCRDTAKTEYCGNQAREILASRRLHKFIEVFLLKHNGLIGALAFRKDESGHCTPLYVSDSISNYISLSHSKYLEYLEKGFSFDELTDTAEKFCVPDFIKLTEGKIDRTPLSESRHDIQLGFENIFEDYYAVTCYRTGAPRALVGVPSKGIFVRTFGFFDVFVDGVPIVFSNSKEKELLALLIDRNGGTMTSSEAIAYLWEDEAIDERLHARYRKLAMGLNTTLKKYGVSDIIKNSNGVRSIDPSLFTCDYYELLSGNLQYVQSFHNSYMSDYSWSERTLSLLWDYT